MERPIAIKGFSILIDSKHTGLREQIYDSIAGAIRSGRVGAGSELPSLRDLAAALDTSVVTVSSVYIRLTNEGLIVRRFGKAHIVAAGKNLSKAERIKLLHDPLGSLRIKAARLDLNSDDLVSSLLKRR